MSVAAEDAADRRSTARGSTIGEAAAFAGGAFLLSLAVLLPTIGRQSLWIDEAITAKVVGLPWYDLVADRFGQGHFPTYFLVLKALGGGSEAALRLPSALLGGLAAALFTLTALRLGGRLAALATVLLFAFLPSLVFYGQEARPYTWMLSFLGIATYAQLELIAGRGRPSRLAILATLGAILAALAIPSGAVTVAVQHVSLALAARRRLDVARRAALRRHIVVTWVVIAIAALALLPSVFVLRHEPGGWMKWQLGMTAGQRIAEAWRETYGFAVREDADRYLPAGWEAAPSLVFCALAVAGIVIRRREIAIRMLAGNVVGLPLVFIALGVFTATAGRYLIGMLPSAILLAACGAAALLEPGRFRWPLAAVLAGATALLALQAMDAVTSDSRYDWRSVARFLSANDVRGVDVLTNNSQTAPVLGYYLSDRNLRFRTASPPAETIDGLWSWARGSDTAWMLLFYQGGRLPADVARGRSVCRWNFGPADLIVATTDPAQLPATLQHCAD